MPPEPPAVRAPRWVTQPVLRWVRLHRAGLRQASRAPRPLHRGCARFGSRESAARPRRNGRRSIASLARVAPWLVFGGPTECPACACCLRGLRQPYGLHFRPFVPPVTGGPLTLQALEAGGIAVTLLVSTDPAITAEPLVVPADDRSLQPAEGWWRTQGLTSVGGAAQ